MGQPVSPVIIPMVRLSPAASSPNLCSQYFATSALHATQAKPRWPTWLLGTAATLHWRSTPPTTAPPRHSHRCALQCVYARGQVLALSAAAYPAKNPHACMLVSLPACVAAWDAAILLSLYLLILTSLYLFACLPTFLHAPLLACFPARLPTCLPGCFLLCLPVCVLAFAPACFLPCGNPACSMLSTALAAHRAVHHAAHHLFRCTDTERSPPPPTLPYLRHMHCAPTHVQTSHQTRTNPPTSLASLNPFLPISVRSSHLPHPRSAHVLEHSPRPDHLLSLTFPVLRHPLHPPPLHTHLLLMSPTRKP